MKPLGLTGQEKADLVAFLETLTSNIDPTTVPVCRDKFRPENHRHPCATSLLTLVSLAGLSVAAYAAKQTVHQKGRMFSTESITIKKGDTVTFVNDDNVPHNIASTSKGNEFNLGSQGRAPRRVTFKEAGDAQVICAIHPRMKMTVTVTN